MTAFRLLLLTALAISAQTALVTAPVEKLTVNLGFRDWSAAVVAGNTVLAGNQTGTGGLFAVDAATGKQRWSLIPALNGGTASVSTAAAVAGNVVIVPFAAAYPGATIAVALGTGKELWRGPDPERGAAVAVDGGLAYVLDKKGVFWALDVATGKERWKAQFASNKAACASRPIVRDGVIYFTAIGENGYLLLALDATTGAERWRYRAEAPYIQAGACLEQPVVTADTIYGAGENRLYAVWRATGKDRFASIEIRRPVDGRERAVKLFGLVDAGPVLIGMTEGQLIAFDLSTGRTMWELAGTYREGARWNAMAGKVLYFQSMVDGAPTLQGLDVESRKVLWSFSRKTAQANWPFGHVTPVNGGLWVNSYQALLKLE